MRSVVLVTATSFMKNLQLRKELEESILRLSLPNPPDVTYLDMREATSKVLLDDPLFVEAVECWLVGGEEVSADSLIRFPNLSLVSKYGVGLDNIDFEACRARSVDVVHKPGVNALAVAEHALGLILSMTRNIHQNANMLRSGIWNKDGGLGLQGMSVGIIGLGATGSNLAKLLKMLGAELSYCDLEEKKELEQDLEIKRLSFDELLSKSQLLSFHVPLTDQTYKMMDEKAFGRISNGTYLVNTSRGGVIDETALQKALLSGKVRGAALDVFESEPLHDMDLAVAEGLIGTPHTAGNSRQAVEAMGRAALNAIETYYLTKKS